MKTYLLAVCYALVQLAHADDLPVDAALASNAVAVVRVSLIFSHDNSKTEFTDNLVHTIRVFKNESNHDFRDIDVLSFKGRPGVPEKECTIYIQAWDVKKHEFSRDRDAGSWILVGGDATNGVSHIEQSVTRWKPFSR
jgi:hypothetical protein